MPLPRDSFSQHKPLATTTIDQNQFLAPTDARLVGGASQLQQQQPQNFGVNRSLCPPQTQPLPLAHQATISPLDKYYGQQQQVAQPLATNATINGNSNKLHTSNEIDEKLRGFNIHQLRTLAKHKSISTSINKDPMIEKIKTVYRFKNASDVTDTLNSLNSNQRPYQYALLDPDTNPVLIELRKMNNKIEAMADRLDSIERGQKDLRDALSILCNQTNLSRQMSGPTAMIQNQRGRNSDYHL